MGFESGSSRCGKSEGDCLSGAEEGIDNVIDRVSKGDVLLSNCVGKQARYS